MVVRSVGRLRRLAAPVLGEALTPVVTVRFVTNRSLRGAHVTLAVELRRRGGRVLADFELGVQFGVRDEVVVQDDPELLAC